jgi:hypothetical protein
MMAEMEQKATGYGLVILAILFLLWLLKNGNPFLHFQQQVESVSSTIGGVPTGPPTETVCCT